MLTRKSSTTGRQGNPKVRRTRDYRAEYARRIAKGMSKGLGRSQARGHARAGDRPNRSQEAKRTRDYRAEYARRIEKGVSKGLSRSQARGHARAGERPKSSGFARINPQSKEELAIKAMAMGVPIRDAAKGFRLSEQHLRRYAKENVNAVWDRHQRLWIIDDQRPRQFPVYSEGELKTLTLKPYQASEASLYMHAVRQFLWTGDRLLLKPYEGRGVEDVNGRFHRFETDPNRLYELDSSGELNFPEIYRITAN